MITLEDIRMIISNARIQLINSDDGAVEGTFDSVDDIPDVYFDCEVDDMYAYRIDRETHTDEEPVLCICMTNYSETETEEEEN